MIDFSKPGADGELPADFVEFQRGLICTVDPRVLGPLAPGEEYRVLASTRQMIPLAADVDSYGPFYRRAKKLLHTRCVETQAETDGSLHSRVVAHGWFGMDVSRGRLVGAVILAAIGISGDSTLPGQNEPTPVELRSPFVAQLPRSLDYRDWLRWDEFYNDFDLRTSEGSIMTVSYGEYVSQTDGLDYAPIVRRAEHRAKAYHQLLHEDGDRRDFAILRREWRCIETGKQPRPLMAHVDIYF
jgi:hypothetical protein